MSGQRSMGCRDALYGATTAPYARSHPGVEVNGGNPRPDRDVRVNDRICGRPATWRVILLYNPICLVGIAAADPSYEEVGRANWRPPREVDALNAGPQRVLLPGRQAFETGHSMSRRALRRQVVPHRRCVTGAAFPGQDILALRRDIVGGARGQRHDGQAGVGGALRGQDAAVGYEQIGDIVRLQEAVHHRGARIASHARGPHQVRVSGLLHDLLRPRGPHDLLYLLAGEVYQLLVVVV